MPFFTIISDKSEQWCPQCSLRLLRRWQSGRTAYRWQVCPVFAKYRPSFYIFMPRYIKTIYSYNSFLFSKSYLNFVNYCMSFRISMCHWIFFHFTPGWVIHFKIFLCIVYTNRFYVDNTNNLKYCKLDNTIQEKVIKFKNC